MVEVSVTEVVDAPAAAVWSLIGGFNDMRRWVPGVEHSTKIGDGIGAERILLISGGAKIAERMDARDEAGWTYTYSLIGGPLPASGYTTTLRVIADNEETCRVSWSSHIEPEGLPAEKVAQLYTELYRAGIANIRRIMTRSQRRHEQEPTAGPLTG